MSFAFRRQNNPSRRTARRLQITRLINIGIEPYLVASAVKLVVAQRLLRRICTICKTDVDLAELERWLQGDVDPSAPDEGEVGTAIGRGVRRIFVTMLRLPSRRFRVDTDSFQFNPRRPG